jgi:hypothetical protein
MKIKIAIVVLCWLVLFVTAQEIEDQSIQKMMGRNTHSIGMTSDSVLDSMADFISDFIPENIIPSSKEGGIENHKNNCLISSNPDQPDTDGDGFVDTCDVDKSENAAGSDAEENGSIGNKNGGQQKK